MSCCPPAARSGLRPFAIRLYCRRCAASAAALSSLRFLHASHPLVAAVLRAVRIVAYTFSKASRLSVMRSPSASRYSTSPATYSETRADQNPHRKSSRTSRFPPVSHANTSRPTSSNVCRSCWVGAVAASAANDRAIAALIGCVSTFVRSQSSRTCVLSGRSCPHAHVVASA